MSNSQNTHEEQQVNNVRGNDDHVSSADGRVLGEDSQASSASNQTLRDVSQTFSANSQVLNEDENGKAAYKMIFGHKVSVADIFKLLGLLAFIVIIGLIVYALWPSLSRIFEPNGTDKVIESIQSQGAFGVLMLLGLQFLQVVVAFIPGEVVQVAAGILYGPWLGSLIILFGCVVSSAVIYELVHRLGAPFVRDMISKEHLEKFYTFEQSGKLNVVVFILFLIPAMPKDVFTYLVPLTSMRMRTFLILTTIGRIPGVLISTYAAAGLAEGEITTSLIIFGVAAAIALVCLIFRNRIMRVLGTTKAFNELEKKREEHQKKHPHKDHLHTADSHDKD
ncbi:MAG TPA: TVP38/TMEM64 family protein [Eggerthellaceae bacterium]|nr:TVP38/TMEM64 family protein [Eggerthellaceae bacterium]